MARSRNKTDQASWRVPKGVVASVATVVAVVSVAALAVVASLKNADLLATVALTLALLSFVLQILIFIVQTSATNSQLVQSQHIYGETSALLSRIQAQVEGARSTVDRMSDRLLEAALGKATAETEGSPAVDPAAFARRVREIIEPELQSETVAAAGDWTGRYPPPQPDRAIVRYMEQWPSEEEAEEVAEELRKLTPTQREALVLYAQDEVSSRQPGAGFGPGFYGSRVAGALVSAGLLDELPDRVDDDGDTFKWLTPKGRKVGRIFTAVDEPPQYLREIYSELVEPVTKSVADRRARRRAAISAADDPPAD
jgi:hypothetical protein